MPWPSGVADQPVRGAVTQPGGLGEPSASEQAGARAAKNTVVRAGSEVIGKIATFAVFAALARSLGESSVGVFVFALAYLQIAMYLVLSGADPYMLRRVANDHAAADRLFFNVLAVKLLVAGPVLALALGLLPLIANGATTRDTVLVLAAGVLIEQLGKTLHAMFDAHERGPLLGTSLVVQRVVTAVLAIAAITAGYGVVTVAAIYSIGAALGFGAGVVLLARGIGIPRRTFDPRGWPALVKGSLPFGLQDIFGVLLFRLDAVLLAILATDAAVGRYGAAYRLLESTLFVSWALNGAFAAMYAYLDRDTEPTIGGVFQRSVKVALVVLAPAAIACVALAEPIMRLAFGPDFVNGASALRLLGPAIVLVALVTMCTALVYYHGDPRAIFRITGVMVVLNVVLNLVLIPRYQATGAAAAMLATEIVFAFVVMRLSVDDVGGIQWTSLLTAPLAAGAAMGLVLFALSSTPAVALAVGLAAYAAVYLAVERIVSPDDLAFVRTLVRRLRRRLALSGS